MFKCGLSYYFSAIAFYSKYLPPVMFRDYTPANKQKSFYHYLAIDKS